MTNQNPQTIISAIQDRTLNNLLGAQTASKLLRFELEDPAKAFTLTAMIDELRKGIFSELSLKKPVDMYRRNLQKSFIEKLTGMIDNSQSGAIVFSFGGGGASISQGISRTSDAVSVARAALETLQNQIKNAIPGYAANPATRNHLADLSDRIKKSLDPKN